MRKEFSIKDKKVDVFPEHHMVLRSWAMFRQQHNFPPLLISLDHHTDTQPAFRAAAFDSVKLHSNDALIQKMISDINFRDNDSVMKAVEHLRHDEHIDAAIKSRIISKAFIISYEASSDVPSSYEESAYIDEIRKTMVSRKSRPARPQRPFRYPDADIYIVENICSVGCQRRPHDEDCLIPHYNQAVESVLLAEKLSIMKEMCPSVFTGSAFNVPYILDIDLDYFHTCKSIMPEDATVFHNLIKGAGLISVATEKDFIDMWREEHGFDKSLQVEFLLEQLCCHIRCATEK